jgi:hypothetical protein
MLAGQDPSDVIESRDLFVATLGELGIALPDADTAHWCLVRQAARDIVARRVDPAVGANVMWDAYTQVRESGDLRIFVGLLSELDGFPQGDREIEAQIVEEAKSLLSRGAPRHWVKLMGRSGRSPLTQTSGDTDLEIDRNTLPISTVLRSEIDAWGREYERVLEGWPESGGFRSTADAETFVEQGRRIVAELQRELGTGYFVEYMSEPIRPPGVKLRRSKLSRLIARLLD